MPDTFFSTSTRKRRRNDTNSRPGRKPAFSNRNGSMRSSNAKDIKRKGKGKYEGSNGSRKRPEDDEGDDDDDEEIDSDDLEGNMSGDDQEDLDNYEDEQDSKETAAQKRLRLAQEYLASLKESAEAEDDDVNAADIDRDIIDARLQEDVVVESGKLHIFCGKRISNSNVSLSWTPPRLNQYSVTSAVLSLDGKYLYTSSKNGIISKWSLAGDKPVRLRYMKKHSGEVLSLSLNDNGTRLAAGGVDKMISIWNVEKDELSWVAYLKGHRDRVSSVSFRKGSPSQLFTSSYDRTVKIFDATSCAYVETLFGHQDSILNLSCLRGEIAITAGSRDRTVRYWKIADETQLVFRSGEAAKNKQHNLSDESTESKSDNSKKLYLEGSTDCVSMIDDNHFLSGGDSGTISLWNTAKKKAVFSYIHAHGVDDPIENPTGTLYNPRWITSLSCLPYGDTFASGSWDGHIRIWRLDNQLRSFSPITQIEAKGFINSLQVIIPSSNTEHESLRVQNPSELVILAGTGQEHRLGRWMKVKSAVNSGLIARIKLASETSES